MICARLAFLDAFDVKLEHPVHRVSLWGIVLNTKKPRLAAFLGWLK